MLKPKKGEEYFFIFANGNLSRTRWDDDVTDNGYYKIGNCFKTREEAEFAVERLKVIHELKEFAAECNEYKINWNNENQPKYYFEYNCGTHRILIDFSYKYQGNEIYFTSEEIALKAITRIGKERIEKYYFCIEE